MTTLKIAHLREQGVDLIIVPLDRSFGSKSEREQENAIEEITIAARSAGLAGLVVPVWDGGGGRMAFRARSNVRPFFKSIGLPQVYASLNRTLTW